MKMQDLNNLVDEAIKLNVRGMVLELFEDDFKELYNANTDWTKRDPELRKQFPVEDTMICTTEFGPLVLKRGAREKKDD